MKHIDYKTGIISLSQGDTADIPFRIKGLDLSNMNAIVVFSLKRHDKVIKEKYYFTENNRFVVHFYNEDTENLNPSGAYNYDITLIVDPVYDDSERVINGRHIKTLISPTRFNIRKAVRKISGGFEHE